MSQQGTYPELTQEEETFCQALVVDHMTQRQAYIKAYPHKKDRLTTGSLDTAAFFLAHKGKIVDRCKEISNTIRSNGNLQALWTRENSIEKLKYVIDKNQEEMERIAAAFDTETAQILEDYEACDDEKQQASLAKQLVEKMKKRRMTNVHNMGITTAVAELNKMQGFNETTVNMNETVKFTGELDLKD